MVDNGARRGNREFDLILWGATGFTGRLVAEYLEERYGETDLRWALGGRDAARLESLRDQLGATEREIVVADALDRHAMVDLVRRTRVVCTTVGPYARYGSMLVAACADEGTDACDISGEVPWMRRMRREHEATAAATGARIVHACGFDSIPSDLGVWFVQREAKRRFGAPCPLVKGALISASGGISGGTIASMLELFEGEGFGGTRSGTRFATSASGHADPESGPRARARMVPHADPDLDSWLAPFPMAPVNTDVVRRSAERRTEAYGPGFRYEESMATGRGVLGAVRAYAIGLGLAASFGAMSVGPIRRRIAPRLPQPGEGPSEEARESGHWEFRFVGIPSSSTPGPPVRVWVRGDRDPGYGSTSRMLAECAVGLAEGPREAPGGFHTPVSSMGDSLVARLQRNAGLTFEVVDASGDELSR